MSIHVVVMGVAGCGKSTVAEAIHERLGYVYAEGDDFHPQANIDKMSAGIPLTDEDRWPWLKVINTWMVAREALDENTVVSSSALKRSYREVLAQNVPTFFVHLTGSQELIQQRLNERKGHFMPPARVLVHCGDGTFDHFLDAAFDGDFHAVLVWLEHRLIRHGRVRGRAVRQGVR